MKSSFIALLTSLMLFTVVNISNAGHGKSKKHKLNKMFYHKSCPQVETIVREITWSKVKANSSMAAKLLRLHYHDCFVRGCDASLLLDSVGGVKAEKEAVPNHSISGYDVIDEIKARLEEECPETVSCADIVAIAARDAVSYQFQRSMWNVYTGRKDGRISLASEASRDLPSGGANFTTLRQQFATNGLNIEDLVALSGAHTIGVARCAVFSRRLFNFTGKGDTDPSLDPQYAEILKKQCFNSPSTTVDMDPGSSLYFDSDYFEALYQNKGLFRSDAALLTDSRSALIAKLFQNDTIFLKQFARSMMKMGAAGVLTGDNGEIRKNCRVVN